MAWKQSTFEKYDALAQSIGGKIIEQVGDTQEAVILMKCGHERQFPVSTLSQHQKLRCKVCWAQEKIQELKSQIDILEKVTN